jgi:hypothetical protein
MFEWLVTTVTIWAVWAFPFIIWIVILGVVFWRDGARPKTPEEIEHRKNRQFSKW